MKTNCDYCGIEFNKKPSRIKKTNKDFCSMKCKGKWLSENKRGEDNPNYKGARKKIKCQNCGKEF